MYFDKIKASWAQDFYVQYNGGGYLAGSLNMRDIYLCVKKVETRKTIAARHVLQNRLTLQAAVYKNLHNLKPLLLLLPYYSNPLEGGGVNLIAILFADCSLQLRRLNCLYYRHCGLFEFLRTQNQLEDLWLSYTAFSIGGDYTSPIIGQMPSLTNIGWSGWIPHFGVLRPLIRERASEINSFTINLSILLYQRDEEKHYILDPDMTVFLEGTLDLGPHSAQLQRVQIIFPDHPTLLHPLLRITAGLYMSLQYLEIYFSQISQERTNHIFPSCVPSDWLYLTLFIYQTLMSNVLTRLSTSRTSRISSLLDLYLFPASIQLETLRKVSFVYHQTSMYWKLLWKKMAFFCIDVLEKWWAYGLLMRINFTFWYVFLQNLNENELTSYTIRRPTEFDAWVENKYYISPWFAECWMWLIWRRTNDYVILLRMRSVIDFPTSISWIVCTTTTRKELLAHHWTDINTRNGPLVLFARQEPRFIYCLVKL